MYITGKAVDALLRQATTGTEAKPLGAVVKPLGTVAKPLGAVAKPLGAVAKPLRASKGTAFRLSLDHRGAQHEVYCFEALFGSQRRPALREAIHLRCRQEHESRLAGTSTAFFHIRHQQST